MKNYKKYIGCLSLSVLTLIGCEDLKFGEKFLDKPISNEQNIDLFLTKRYMLSRHWRKLIIPCRIICRCKDVWDMAFWKC